MIHELRIYTCLPGRLPALQQRFETATLAIWEQLGIRSLGFWTTMIGSSSNDLTYLLEWRSLAEREQKWAEFVADRERRKRGQRARRMGRSSPTSPVRCCSRRAFTAASPSRRNNGRKRSTQLIGKSFWRVSAPNIGVLMQL